MKIVSIVQTNFAITFDESKIDEETARAWWLKTIEIFCESCPQEALNELRLTKVELVYPS